MEIKTGVPTLFYGIELEGMNAGLRTLFVANDVPEDLIYKFSKVTNAAQIYFGAGGLTQINFETFKKVCYRAQEQRAADRPVICLEASPAFLTSIAPADEHWKAVSSLLQKDFVYFMFYFSDNASNHYFMDKIIANPRTMIKSQRDHVIYIGWSEGHQLLLDNDPLYEEDILLWEQK